MDPIKRPTNPDTRYMGELPQFVPSEAARSETERANATRATNATTRPNEAGATHGAASRFGPKALDRDRIATQLLAWVDEASRAPAQIQENNEREMRAVKQANAVHSANEAKHATGAPKPYTADALAALKQEHSDRIASAYAEIALRETVAGVINQGAKSAVAGEPFVEVFIPYVEHLPYLDQADLVITRLPKALPESTGLLHPSMAATGHSTISTETEFDPPISRVQASVNAALQDLANLPFSPQLGHIFDAVRYALKEIQSMESGQAHACQSLSDELENLMNRMVNPDSMRFVRASIHDVNTAKEQYKRYS